MSHVLHSTELTVDLDNGKRLVFPELHLEKGELVLLQGLSGSGKSTWMHALAGLIPIASGAVQIDGQGSLHAGKTAPTHWRRNGLSFMPQRAFFWNSLSLKGNLDLAAWCKGLQVADADLETLGLARMTDQASHSLSLGEQQRVSALRSFLGNAPVLLADEPTASLDDANAEALMKLFKEHGKGRAILVSSHDQRLAPFVARIIHLS
ncbi:MAG: ATP-binding cassette domain-containing protein [Schleiferiaceae bacterium]